MNALVRHPRMKKRIYDYLTMLDETNQYEFRYDLEDIFEHVSEKFGLEKYETKFLVFSYLIEEIEDDPTRNYRLDDWLYKIPHTLKIPFLKESGYYDKYFLGTFNDVNEVDGKFLLDVDGWSDFNKCFDSKYIAEQVFSEDYLEMFDFSYNDINLKNDVLEELNNRSIESIMNQVKKYKGQILENMGQFDDFSDDEEDPILTDELIVKIGSNISMLSDLLNHCELFDGIQIELYNAYRNAYNGAAESELFKNLSSEITSFFGSDGEWNGNILTFDITKIYHKVIDTLLIDLDRNPFDEYTYFMSALELYLDETNEQFDTPSMDYYYPSHNLVEKYLNEYIIDNI